MITVVDYDPSWPQRFEALRQEYVAAFARAGVSVVTIEHVGSTSVPGLAAKPIIDCDIVITETDLAVATDVLTGLGFRALGELGIPQRWAFREPPRLAGTNTYLVVDGCLSLRNHRAVRETLRARSDLRDRYGALKQQVAATAANPEEYGRGKNGLVQEILAVAGLSEAERRLIDSAQVPPIPPGGRWATTSSSPSGAPTGSRDQPP